MTPLYNFLGSLEPELYYLDKYGHSLVLDPKIKNKRLHITIYTEEELDAAKELIKKHPREDSIIILDLVQA